MTSNEFYQLTPIEFHWALQDHEKIQSRPIKTICNTLRAIGVVIHNSAPFRKRIHKIKDPKKLMTFEWDKPELQTVEQMKAAVMGLAHLKGVKVTQGGKEVDEMGRVKEE